MRNPVLIANKITMNESTKSQAHWGAAEKLAIQGNVIDIACGPDPVTPSARRFDLEHGGNFVDTLEYHARDCSSSINSPSGPCLKYLNHLLT